MKIFDILRKPLVNRVFLYVGILVMLGLLLTGSQKFHLLLFPVLVFLIGEKICDKKDRYLLSFSGIVLLLLSPIVIRKLTGYQVIYEEYVGTLCVSVGITALLMALAFVLNRNKLGAIMYGVLVLIPVSMVGIMWSYYFSVKAWVSDEVLLALVQTNMSESMEWLKDFINFKAIIAFGIVIVLALVLIQLAPSLGIGQIYKDKKRFFYLCGLVVGAIAVFFLGQKDNIYSESYKNAKLTLDRYNKFKASYDRRAKNINHDIKLNKKGSDGVYVMIIGESQNKEHMQAYGYARKNTPWLQQMKDSGKALLYDNMYSCHTHTVPVLSYALTAKNQYNKVDLGKAVSILEVANAAGYNTTWISNQVKYGNWDTPNTVIACSADQQFWLNKQSGETTKTNVFDDSLADQIKKLKIGNKQLIIFHLMGNHGSYDLRYPQTFREYKGQGSVDHYDNSILFNDYVVKRIYEECKKLPNFKGLIYCADHADEVKQGLAHNSSKFVPEMTHIPFYMVLSEDYIRENGARVDLLKSNRESIITNDLLFNIMLSLMGVEAQGIYEADNDIFSDKYVKELDRFKTMHGKRSIKDDPKYKK